jgi:hypothetical protein
LELVFIDWLYEELPAAYCVAEQIATCTGRRAIPGNAYLDGISFQRVFGDQ